MALHHAEPGEAIDLRPLGNELPNAKTTALAKCKSFEAMRLIVLEGTEIPAHQVSGNITLYCLEGRVVLGLDDTALELSAGQWLYLKGDERHSVKGIEDSSLLLTVVFDR